MAKVSLRAYDREIETMIDRGQLDEAIAHCLHILKTFPKQLETYRLLGKAFLEYKRYKDAVDIFTRVLVVEPNDFVANVGMSIIRDEENKLDDAIWHMERAFEVQPSNAAIQGELQRLYGRREGVQPPRIRMTRGALAHMYVQGELYPQAISEIKGVLTDDAGRTDMQVLMARAYFRSGQKNEAADTASAVLRRYPYCLDANRILVEILGADRPENSQLYRQRVIELDPYAAQVSGTIFQTNEVGDNAVSLEHLDWDGKPTSGGQSDWRSAQSLSLDSGFGAQPAQSPQAQPDWLTNGFADETPLQSAPTVVPPLPAATPDFDFLASTPSTNEPEPMPAQPTPEADIPDFLRAAGWGESTGTFDESKMSSFADEPATPAAASASDALPIEQGDMPDWLKAMAPPQVTQPAQPAEEEPLPDWINKIGTGALSSAAVSASSDEFDWLNPTEESSRPQAPASNDQPDWMQQLDQPAAQSSANDQPDWMKQFDQPASQAPASNDQADWLKGFGNESDSTPASATLEDQSDWMKQFGNPAEEPVAPTTSATSGNDFDFLNELITPAVSATPAVPTPADAGNLGVGDQDDSFAWLENLGEPVVSEQTPISQPPVQQPVASATESGTSQSEIDDSLAWLENLAAKQGATEGLLVKPEDRMDKEPEWVAKIKGTSQPPTPEPQQPVVPVESSTTQPAVQQPPVQEPQQAVANVSELGTSQSEIDDSLAWLENLAAKQGATEGLLVKPEDRKDKEPDWIAKIKGTSQPPTSEPQQSVVNAQPTAIQPPVEQTPVQQSSASVADLGTSQSEIDDSLAWLENLAAKQGATEGLLVKPEDRKDKEPDWVTKIKSSSQPPVQQPQVQEPQQQPAATQPPVEPPPAQQPAANVADLGTSQSEIDDSLAWLEGLAAKQGATEGLLVKPEDRMDKEPDWVSQVKSAPTQPTPTQVPAEHPPVQEQQPATNVADLGESQSEIDDSLAWLENLAAKQGATEGLLVKPEDRMDKEPDWVSQVKSAPVQPTAAQAPAEQPPVQEQPVTSESYSSSADDTTAWLRSLDAEEAKPEPESANDETAMWFRKLDEPAAAPTPQAEQQADDLPAWLKGIEEENVSVAEPAVPASEAPTESNWMNAIEEHPVAESEPEASDENLPSWLKGMDEESKIAPSLSQDDLPAWMRDETGEVVAEPIKIEPTRPTDWHPIEEKQPEPPAPAPQPVVQEQPQSAPVAPVEEKPKPAPVKKAAPKPAEVKPATPPTPYREPLTQRGTGMLTMPIDPILGAARAELSRSNVPGAMATYEKLIKKGRLLDEVIFDLREALNRFPVEISILQALGDAYMRANRLQDALDAYTKAEELLR
jgi:uncharacterized protein Smg (DUF494 family)/tetratricopeptide (TPR) repeat protein